MRGPNGKTRDHARAGRVVRGTERGAVCPGGER
jgi:hypothetical protein